MLQVQLLHFKFRRLLNFLDNILPQKIRRIFAYCFGFHVLEFTAFTGRIPATYIETIVCILLGQWMILNEMACQPVKLSLENARL
jgi:hypothetical protein